MSAPPNRPAKSTLDALLGGLGWTTGIALVGLLTVPLAALFLSTSPAEFARGIADPAFLPALGLSLRTTVISLVLVVVGGIPLAWWLARSATRLTRVVEVVVELPIVLPPAVVGVALLAAFGRRGLLGGALSSIGVELAFSEAAVVVAQVVVSAPFFVQAAANAFRKVDPDIITVARTLGATSTTAFLRVALPIAMPGIVVGASLAWARALGEFGATLVFAGNLAGSTQTMPLAIFTALESDIELAIVLSLVLAAIGALLLVALRTIPLSEHGSLHD